VLNCQQYDLWFGSSKEWSIQQQFGLSTRSGSKVAEFKALQVQTQAGKG